MKSKIVSLIFLLSFLLPFKVSGSIPSITVSPPPHIECSSGEGLILKCHAEGTKPLQYTWIKGGIEVSKDEALFLKDVSIEDQGEYVCIVRNVFGVETSSVCKLTVTKLQNIQFSAKPQKGIAPLTVNFFSKSLNKNEEYYWDFGDSTYSRQKNPVHIYRNNGIYRVTLIVKAPGFHDSLSKGNFVQVSSLSRNKPHKVSKKHGSTNDTDPISHKRNVKFPALRFFHGNYFGNDSLEVIFSNYDALNYPGVDTILLWYGLNSVPDFSDKKHLRKIDPGFFYSDSENDSIFISIKDPLFSQKADSGYCALMMVSKYNAHSDTFLTSFSLKKALSINSQKRSTNIYPIPLQIINSYTDQNHIIHVIYSPRIPKCKSVNVFCSQAGIAGETNQTFLFNHECKDTIDSLQFDPDRYIPLDNSYEISLWPQDFSSNMYTPDENGRFIINLKRSSNRTVYSFDSLQYPVFDGSVYIKTIRNSKGRCSIQQVRCPDISGTVSIGDAVKITPLEVPFKLQVGFSPNNNYQKNDVRICAKTYNGHDSLMCFLKTLKDTLNGIIWSEIEIQNEMAIFQIIDTVHPEVFVVSDTAKVIKPGISINDTLIIKDNIPGCKWKIFGGEAGTKDYSSDSGFISSTLDTLTFSLPSKLDQAYSSGGLRIYFQLIEGNWVKTVDLSRKIIRLPSEISVNRLSWTPVITSYTPRFSSPESVFINLCNERIWRYNTQDFRIFKLNNKEDNHDNPWMEYSQKQSRNFSVEPGKVIWVKTKESQKLVIPAGVSFPIKDTFSIILQPRSWNDFAIPYTYNISLEDIYKSSGPACDSTDFFLWKKGSGSIYHLSPLYITGLTGKRGQITLTPGQPYCAYNPTSKEVILRIPPEFSSKVTATSTTKEPDDSLLMATIRIINRNNETLSELVLNGRSEINHSPVPISISGINFQTPDDSFCILNKSVSDQSKNNGSVCHLRILNTSLLEDSVQLEAFTNNKSFEVSIFNPKMDSSDNGYFRISSGEKIELWAICGTEDFINKSIDSLKTKTLEITNIISHNDTILISNWIPFDGLENASVSICDGSGTIVWHKVFQYLEGGPGFIVWDGETDRYTKAGAGFYIIRISGLKEKGKTISTSRNIFYSRDSNETF
jgi:PKD repeat protein